MADNARSVPPMAKARKSFTVAVVRQNTKEHAVGNAQYAKRSSWYLVAAQTRRPSLRNVVEMIATGRTSYYPIWTYFALQVCSYAYMLLNIIISVDWLFADQMERPTT